MIAANFSEFRTGLKTYLDRVEDENETLVVKRRKGKGSVVISIQEYNSLMETIYLLSSKKNSDRLFESIQQMNNGQVIKPELLDQA